MCPYTQPPVRPYTQPTGKIEKLEIEKLDIKGLLQAGGIVGGEEGPSGGALRLHDASYIPPA